MADTTIITPLPLFPLDVRIDDALPALLTTEEFDQEFANFTAQLEDKTTVLNSVDDKTRLFGSRASSYLAPTRYHQMCLRSRSPISNK